MQVCCREIRLGCELSLGMLKPESDTFSPPSPTPHHWLTFIAENVQEHFPKKNVKQEISEIEATDLGIPLISIDSGSNPTVSTRSSL